MELYDFQVYAAAMHAEMLRNLRKAERNGLATVTSAEKGAGKRRRTPRPRGVAAPVNIQAGRS